jgi:hypothetical protein
LANLLWPKRISARKQENLAATYSRASYTGTTIGNAAFDGRVRDGIGSDHSFMATKKHSGQLPLSVVSPANGLTPNVKDHRSFETNSEADSTEHGLLTTKKTVFSENYT